MGKLYISLEDDLNLVDLIRGQVAVALEILLLSPKTKAEYAKSFASALQVVQNIKKLLTFSTQATNEGPKKKEAEQQTKINPNPPFQNASSVSNHMAGKKPNKKQEAQSIAGNSNLPICPSTSSSEPIQKVAKTTEKPKTATETPSPADGWTPAQKSLANSLIVQKMMENLPARTLKSCRMVCKLWKEEATKQLLTSRHNQFLEVKLRWSENNEEYQHISLGTLQAFLDFCLKKSRRFPCVQFQFVGGDLSSPAFLNFFTKFGVNVKFLQLSPSTNNEHESSLALKTLALVLFKLAPNLEGLTLDSVDWTRGQDLPTEILEMPENRKKGRGFQKLAKIQNDPQMAPNFKKLTLPLQRNRYPTQNSEMNHALLNILDWAPNLVSIEDKNLFFTRELVAAGKLDLVKFLKFHLEHDNLAIDRRCTYFSEQGPQLETIEFSCRFGSFASGAQRSALSAILRSSQHTLKTVFVLNEVDLRSIQIPPLKKVEHMHLKPTLLSNGLKLPPNTKFVDCFPNLSKITGDSKIFGNPVNSSKIVESLFLTIKPSAQLIRDAESMYPNLKLISLKVVDYEAQNLPETIRAICSSFPRLEVLRIFMKVSSCWFSLAEMDSALTGLPLSLCKDPAERQREIADAKVLKSLEKNGQPSIRSLKKLKELQICLRQPDSHTRVHRICTRISDLYAFDLMKQRQGLKVWETVQNWF